MRSAAAPDCAIANGESCGVQVNLPRKLKSICSAGSSDVDACVSVPPAVRQRHGRYSNRYWKHKKRTYVVTRLETVFLEKEI